MFRVYVSVAGSGLWRPEPGDRLAIFIPGNIPACPIYNPWCGTVADHSHSTMDQTEVEQATKPADVERDVQQTAESLADLLLKEDPKERRHISTFICTEVDSACSPGCIAGVIVRRVDLAWKGPQSDIPFNPQHLPVVD
jgi:hypothetical protein